MLHVYSDNISVRHQRHNVAAVIKWDGSDRYRINNVAVYIHHVACQKL